MAGVDALVEGVRGLGVATSRREETLGGSRVRVVKATRMTETCERHVPQMLVRGEHVCSVVVLK